MTWNIEGFKRNVFNLRELIKIEFMAELSKLSALLLELVEKYASAAIYLRGDFNVNDKNPSGTFSPKKAESPTLSF